ncbi:GTP-binding protein, partial [Enterococcus lactis]
MRVINIVVLAHVDAGKTNLTESLLYNSGANTALGSG